MESIFVCLLLTLTTVLVVLAAPAPESSSSPTFAEFFDDRNKVMDGCTFPPITVLSKDKFKSCMDNKGNGSINNICDGIMDLSTKVCSRTNWTIPIPDVVELLYTGEIVEERVATICRSVEIQRFFTTDEKCIDVCSKEKAYFPCELYMAMLRSVYSNFEGISSQEKIHTIIHHLPSYFPFPPHGSMDKGNYLEACENETESKTAAKFLCSLIPKLAKLFGERNIKVDSLVMMKNVTADWDPCPLLTQNVTQHIRQLLTSDNCDDYCNSQTPNAPICRSIAFGREEFIRASPAELSTLLPKNVNSVTIMVTEWTEKSVTDESLETVPNPNETLPSNIGSEASGGKDKNSSLVPNTGITNRFSSQDTENNATKQEDIKGRGNNTNEAETTVKLKTNTTDPESTTNTGLGPLTTGTINPDGIINGSGTPLTTGTTKKTSEVTTTKKTIEVTTTKKTIEITTKMNDVTTKNSTDVVTEKNNATEDVKSQIDENENGEDRSEGEQAKENNDNNDGLDEQSETQGLPVTDSEYPDQDTVSGGGSFMSYFLVFIVLCVAGYIVFHNKQKIIALVIEGKHSSTAGRRPSSKDYRQLKTDDVMPSLEKSANTSNYIY